MIMMDNEQLVILHGLEMAKLLEDINPSAAEYVRDAAKRNALHYTMSTYKSWTNYGSKVNMLHSIFQ